MEEKKRGISRREFLKDAGLVVGGAAVGAAITYPLVPKEVVKEVEVIKEVEVTKFKCPYCGVTVDTFDALKAHVTAQHPVEAIPEEVPKYVCPTCSAEFDSFSALKAHFTAEHPPGVVEPAFEPEETYYKHIFQLGAVDVKNGKIIRRRPLHYEERYPELKPFTYTTRGKTLTYPMKSPLSPYDLAYKKRTYSPNRIKYPLKRVDWEPGGDPKKINAHNRGKSKYKRISWDEATDIIASEMKRLIEKYGPSAISAWPCAHGETKVVHAHSEVLPVFCHYWLFSKYGKTCTEMQQGPNSWEGAVWGSKHVWGHETLGYERTTGLLKDIADNTEMLLQWGCDSESKVWNRPGGQLSSIAAYFARDLGIKRVYICPDVDQAVAVHADKWIPVLPNTDAALELAIAYTWLTEGTYDKDYLKTHAVGYDKWFDYVLGVEDGVAKTPAWASPRCGVPEWTIKALAGEWATKVTSIGHGGYGGGKCRAPYSHETMRMENYLLAMQGWGKPGRHQVTGVLTPPRPPVEVPLKLGKRWLKTRILGEIYEKLEIRLTTTDDFRQYIPLVDMADAILKPPVYWHGGGVFTATKWQFWKNVYPREGFSEIKMIWVDEPGWLGSGGYSCGNVKFKAWQNPKVEFILMQHLWMEDACVAADIILPINTKLEEYDIQSVSDSVASLFLEKKCVEPIGESKSDYEAICEIAKKVGFYDEWTGGKSVEEWVRVAYDMSGWEKLVSWEKLNEDGYCAQPLDPDWGKAVPPSLAFYEDPVNNPLQTPTGLLEFYSQTLADEFPDDKERPPMAKWIIGGPPDEGWTHDETIWGERAKKYPLLMVSNTRTWGEHPSCTDIPWIREISKVKCWDGYMYEPVVINPVDAAARGIKSGDIVNIYNERGGNLGGAVVEEMVIPGAVAQNKGGGVDYIIHAEINRGGSNNSICPQKGISKNCKQGIAPTAYLVEVEKVTGNQMDEWRKNYPEAFARDYDPAYGPLFSGWVEGGM